MGNKVTRLWNEYTKRKATQYQRVQRENQVVKNRILLFGGVLTLIIVVLLVMIIQQNNNNQQLSVTLNETESVLESRIQEEKDLEQQIVQLNDDHYIMRIARSEFNMSEHDEIIFNIPKEETSDE